MNYPEYEYHDEAQEDSEVEIIDLDLPGEISGEQSLLPGNWFLAWQRSLNRGKVRLAMSLCMLFLVALVLLLNVHLSFPSPVRPNTNTAVQYAIQPPPINIKTSNVILPQKDGFACLNDAAWSPDSQYIALLGYQKDCASSGQIYEPGLIAVHNALSGKLIKQVSPDDAILHAFSRQFPVMHKTLVIYYNSILWSPNGKNLALTFNVGLPSSLTAGFNGVILIPNGGGNVQVLLHSQKDFRLPVEWDLQQHKAIGSPSIPSLSPFIAAGTAIAPAFAYRWGTNGALLQVVAHHHFMLIPRFRLISTRLGRVGNPDGDPSFTMWQPGTSTIATQDHYGITAGPGVYTWRTSFVAWSPDGRYLMNSFSLQGRLQPAGQPVPDQRILVNLHMDQLPVLAVRDMALQHLLMILNPASLNMMISWHPAGFVLAAYNGQTTDLDLFDCIAGYEIASLQLPSPFANPILAGTSFLRWSPDGSKLILFDPQLGMAMIWRFNHLPG